MQSKTETSTEKTPAELGYRWPAEWEPHAATWLSWPHNLESWPGKFEPVPAEFAEFVRAVAASEPVHIFAGKDDVYEMAHKHVGNVANVTLHPIETNDAWCRDHGPIFLKGKTDALPPALVDFEYNAWGEKYPPFDKDNLIPRQVAEMLGYRRFAPGIVCEGGAIEGNGAGILLTTEACLLRAKRNPDLSQQQVEQVLSDCLAVDRFLWLPAGDIAGDDTDGHVDQVARYVTEKQIVVALEADSTEENFASLQENYQWLMNLVDRGELDATIHTLPMPQPVIFDDQRLPASYCNFYIANTMVAVPQFNDPADAEALAILRDLFPGRDVVGLPAENLVLGLGAFHCLSQQQPLP